MQTARQIVFVSHTARNLAGMRGQKSRLTVVFRVSDAGPAHVAGLVATADGWKTVQTVPAVFERCEADAEVWVSSLTADGSDLGFEYVLFCDDFRGVDAVPRVWNTNGGDTFTITATADRVGLNTTNPSPSGGIRQ